MTPLGRHERKGDAMSLSEVNKTVVTVLGLVVSVGAALLPTVTTVSPQVAGVVSVVLGVATAVLNYLVPNETTNAGRVTGRSVRLKGEQPLPDVAG